MYRSRVSSWPTQMATPRICSKRKLKCRKSSRWLRRYWWKRSLSKLLGSSPEIVLDTSLDFSCKTANMALWKTGNRITFKGAMTDIQLEYDLKLASRRRSLVSLAASKTLPMRYLSLGLSPGLRIRGRKSRKRAKNKKRTTVVKLWWETITKTTQEPIMQATLCETIKRKSR